MKIIRPGKRKQNHDPQLFGCQQCGCIFTATNKEYKYADYVENVHDGIYAKCKCPWCKSTVYLYENNKTEVKQ